MLRQPERPHRRSGQALVEYTAAVALIVLTLVFVVLIFRAAVHGKYSNVGETIDGVANAGSPAGTDGSSGGTSGGSNPSTPPSPGASGSTGPGADPQPTHGNDGGNGHATPGKKP